MVDERTKFFGISGLKMHFILWAVIVVCLCDDDDKIKLKDKQTKNEWTNERQEKKSRHWKLVPAMYTKKKGEEDEKTHRTICLLPIFA